MDVKIKPAENKNTNRANTNRANSNSLRIFALILGLVIAVIIVLVKYNPQLFDSFFKEKVSPAEQILVQDSGLDKIAPAESYLTGPEVPLLSFSPDEKELDKELDTENEDLVIAENMEPEARHPYEIEVEKDELAEKNIDSSEKQIRLISGLNNYRLFLANAERLMTKFRQDQLFYNELRFFNSITHPNMIKNTLLLLDDYNKMLSNPECECTDKFVEIFSSKLMSKFIKVTKISKTKEDQKQLKDGINENLPVLINYIYSPELQGSFIK